MNKVVVFDEAHNIMETMSSINTVQISYSQLMHGYSQIQSYVRKYGGRMNAKNNKSLKDIVSICASFAKYLKKCEVGTVSYDVIDILTELDLYRVDFAKLSDFFSRSDLAKKLNGFIQAQQ